MLACVSSRGRWNVKAGRYSVKFIIQNTAGLSDKSEQQTPPHETLSDFCSPQFAPVNDKLCSCEAEIPGSNGSSAVKQRSSACQVLERKNHFSAASGTAAQDLHKDSQNHATANNETEWREKTLEKTSALNQAMRTMRVFTDVLMVSCTHAAALESFLKGSR